MFPVLSVISMEKPFSNIVMMFLINIVFNLTQTKFKIFIVNFISVNCDFSLVFKLYCITIQKCGVCKKFLMFLKEVSSAHQGCVYLINTVIL